MKPVSSLVMESPHLVYRFTSALTSIVVFETTDVELAQDFFNGLIPKILPRDQVYIETLVDGEIVDVSLLYTKKNSLN